MSETKVRLDWPDVLRGIAVISVYLAHLGTYSARISLFCFSYVVPLFFFVSGLFAEVYSELTLKDLCLKLLKRILIPYVFICIVNIIYYRLFARLPWGGMLFDCLTAVRNKIFSSTLWFLPCLVVMTLVYWALKKAVRNRYLLLVLCFAISMGFKIFKEPSQWFWSSDSAMMYLFYYSLGDYLMPWMRKISERDLRISSQKSIGAAVLTAAVMITGSILVYNTVARPDSAFRIELGDVAARAFTFVIAVFMIAVWVIIALVLRKAAILQTVGRHTMITAFLQSVISWAFTQVCWYIGLTWSVWKDYQTLFYGFALVLFATYVIAVPLKKAASLMRKKLRHT